MHSAGGDTTHCFDRFVLQPAERRLLAHGVPVPIGPRAFDVLSLLVEHAGHLVSKDLLLTTVWPRVVVEENTLQVQVSALRKVLGREAIATVSGRGYRFTLGVETETTLPTSERRQDLASGALPQALTSFVGREKELVELSRLMREARLLTLTGAGGCGKTRLALQLAAGVTSMFTDGVWLVELAALSNAAAVPNATAQVLGLHVSPTASPTQAIANHLGSRRVLLVMDNAEHLRDACAQLADELLKHCPHASMVVTSRESLGITGEMTFRVPSLSVPDRGNDVTPEHVLQFESVRLFVSRARLQRPHFAVTALNAPAIASICRRLDGIPLAIELAAARLRAMAPEEIDRRLDRRFSLLTEGSRTALPRHRTLRSLIDWSYDLLDDAEKVMFSRVSVFADGWTLDAAEQICAEETDDRSTVLDRLASLVDKSLILADDHDGTTRYRQLETMRQYGAERLRETGEEAVWRSRHLVHFAALAKQLEPQVRSPEQAAALDRLGLEQDNIRAGLSWAARGGSVANGLRMCASMFFFWWIRGPVREGRETLRQLLGEADTTVDVAVRGRALAMSGQFAMLQGDYAEALRDQEESLAIYRRLGHQTSVASVLSSMGVALDEQGDFDRARLVRAEALALYRAAGAPAAIATTLNNMGWSARNHGRLDEAQTLLEESLAISRTAGEASGLADVLLNLAGVALDRGEMKVAEELGEESLDMYRRLRGGRGIASALQHLGLLACATSNWSLAKARLVESVAIVQEMDDRSGVAQALDALACAHAATNPERAARLWGAGESLRQRIGFETTATARATHERQVIAARRVLDDDGAFDRAWKEGAAMSTADAVRHAVSDPGGD